MAEGQVPIVNGNSMEIPQNDGLGDLTRDLGPLITQQPMNIPIPPPVQKERMQVQQGGVGRTKAETRRNTTASIAGNIANFVGTVKRNKDAQHNRILQYDLERLMGAMQHPEDPQNKQIINDILSDPKKVKAIEKSLDIHLLDPKENPPETKAFFNAAKKHKEGQQQQSGTGAGRDMERPSQQQQPQTIPMSQPQGMPQGFMQDRSLPPGGGSNESRMTQGGGPAGGGDFQPTAIGQPSVQQPQQQQGQGNPLANLDPKVAGMLRKLMPPTAPGMSPTWQIYAQLVKAGVLMSADKKADVQIKREEIQGRLAVADKNNQGRLIGHLMTMLSSKYTADMGYAGKMDAAFQNHLYRLNEISAKHKAALGEIKASQKVTMLKSNSDVLNSTITEFRKSKDGIAKELESSGDGTHKMWWNDVEKMKKFQTLTKQYQFYTSAINQMESARMVNNKVLGEIVGGVTNGGDRGNGGASSNNTQPTGDAGKSVGPVTPEQLVNSNEFPFAFSGSSYSGANDSDEKDDSEDDE